MAKKKTAGVGSSGKSSAKAAKKAKAAAKTQRKEDKKKKSSKYSDEEDDEQDLEAVLANVSVSSLSYNFLVYLLPYSWRGNGKKRTRSLRRPLRDQLDALVRP